jgi:hypothetical protein
MCLKCQHYRHSQAQCPAREYTCGIYAERHPTWDCRSKHDRNSPKRCTNCKDLHKAVSDTCPVRKKAIRKAKAALYNCKRLHRIPEHFMPKNNSINFLPLASVQARSQVSALTSTLTLAITPAPITNQLAPTTLTVQAIPTTPASRRRVDRQVQPVILDIKHHQQEIER